MSDVRLHTDPTEPLRPEMSLGDVVGKLGDDLSGLLSTQIEIAKLEIKQEVGQAAKGAGLLSSGVVAALIAVLLLSMAAAWGIAEALNPWAGFLIVGLLWAVAAVALALIGKRKLAEVQAVPPNTAHELHADRDLVKRLPNT